MMDFKIIFFIATFFIWQLNHSISQTFEKFIATSLDEVVYDAQLSGSSECVFALNTGDFNDNTYYSKIFKINTNTGSFIDSLIIEPELQGFHFSGIFDLLKANDSLFIGIGKFNLDGGNEQFQYILHFNQNLDVVFDTIIDIPEINESLQKTILAQNSKLVSVGKIQNSSEILICEKTVFGDSIRHKTYNEPSVTASTVVDMPPTNSYHIYIYMGDEHSFFIIDKTTLNKEESIEQPFWFKPIDAIHDDIDLSKYYVAGKNYDVNSGNNDLFFMKVSIDGTYESFIYTTDENIFYTYKCFSPLNNHLYFGGVYPFTPSPPVIYPEERWILLYRLKKDGDIVWQKFYKGGVNYMPYKIVATPDEGALVFSTKYDWNNPAPNQRDVHILKIDSLGYYTPLTGTAEEIEQMERQMLVFPNPVENEVNFVFGLYKDLKVSIFDLTGKRLFSKTFGHSVKIDISHFKPGVYPYTISNGNGFFEEGKLIKK